MRIGQQVTYRDLSCGKEQKGIVKSISDNEHVFVVYNCNNDWDNYKDYTAARTRIIDLYDSWLEINEKGQQ